MDNNCLGSCTVDYFVVVLVIEFACDDQLDQFGFVYILRILGQSQSFDSLDLVSRLSLVPVS